MSKPFLAARFTKKLLDPNLSTGSGLGSGSGSGGARTEPQNRDTGTPFSLHLFALDPSDIIQNAQR